MNTTMRSFVIRMTTTVILLTLGAGAAAVGAAATDDVYTSAGPAAHPCTSVAILPVVSLNENPDAELQVEQSWVEFCGGLGIRWMPADDVRATLAGSADASEDLGARLDAQIWRRGEVDSEVAGRLARTLGVDAVLSVRIDRWEIADGGRAIVELTSVLSGEDGERLWSISGAAGCGAPRNSARRHFTEDLGWFWNPRLEPKELAREKLGCALYTLLARWQGTLPGAPAYAHDSGPAAAEPSTFN